jgi:hypothetical protein
VTLGARSFPLDAQGNPIKGIDRHPIIEDDVVIYSGATVLGRIVIGAGSSIGGERVADARRAPEQPRHPGGGPGAALRARRRDLRKPRGARRGRSRRRSSAPMEESAALPARDATVRAAPGNVRVRPRLARGPADDGLRGETWPERADTR